MKPYRALLTLPVSLALAACTASVSHPTKSPAEMQADIDQCTEWANRRYWMDPVAALYNAYDCLEARGYQRSEGDFAARVERAFGERNSPPQGARTPCQVPCRGD